jgi:hypothetical protein
MHQNGPYDFEELESNGRHPQGIRICLSGLTERSAADLEPLRHLARSALRKAHQRMVEESVDDLVQGLTADLLSRGQSRGGGLAAGIQDLMALDDKGLRAAVLTRLSQVLSEQSPRRHLIKQLREHVTEAFKGNDASSSGRLERPDSLLEGERFSAKKIAAATAWALAQAEAPERTPAAVANWLAAHWQLGEPPPAELEAPEPERPDFTVRRRRDGGTWAKRLEAEMDPRALDVLLRRYCDHDFQRIADERKEGLATVHKRYIEGLAQIHLIFENISPTLGTAQHALEGLAMHRGLR